MNRINLNTRVFIVLLASGIACAVLFASLALLRLHNEADDLAGEEAKLLMGRAVQMFMVSTVKFDKELNQAKTDEEKKAVHQKWLGTIFAVDDAITHDYGAGESRIRLIGDKEITGAAPLGGENTKIISDFERAALSALKADPKTPYQRIEEGYFRIAAPLPAGVHAGCAACHAMSNQVSYPPESLLGSLNAYIPLARLEAKALSNALTLGVAMLVVFVLFSLAISYWIVRHITRPLGGEPREVLEVLRALSGGDMTTAIRPAGSDQTSVMASLKTMQDRWRDILRNLHGNVGQLNQSAQQISGTAASVADASRQQNDATAETAAATEEMTVGIGHISDSTGAAKDIAVQAASLSADGQQLAQKAVVEIDAISAHVRDFEGRIASLGERSMQISSIIGVIKDIADQTNLLALNAAIEAARAGETGRGFAVVADEVRKLAERTTASTTEIRTMIEAIQQETHDASDMMAESRQRIDQGVSAINQLVEPLKKLHDGGREAAQRLAELSDATREQSAAATVVARHIENIAQASDQNAHAVQGVAKAVDNLRAIAQDLDVAVKQFKY